MRQEMEALQGKDDKAIIEAFKKSSDLEELQLNFARTSFKTGKLHVCRVAAASGVKLGDMVKWATEDQ